MLMEPKCMVDGDCAFLFYCNKGVCQHDQIFPLSIYPIFIYILTAFACGLCNISGNSMGIFKVLILMMLLRYQIDEATGLAQALVVGSALPNFFSLIFKRNKDKDEPIINYNLLYVMIPCILLGSTLGALLQLFVPKAGQMLLIMALFSCFIFKFYKKLQVANKKVQQQVTSQDQNYQSLIESNINNNGEQQMNLDEQQIIEKQVFLQYQRSYHVPDILLSFLLFIGFEFIVFLVQGKLPFYDNDKCSYEFYLELIGLIAIVGGYLYLVKNYLKRKYQKYRKYGLEQPISLDEMKPFLMIAGGSFTAGLSQGLLGMGSGTFIMMVLLSFPLDTSQASATSGYLILFTGLGSLTQYVINGEVELDQSGWFVAVCAVLGGAVTLVFYRIISKFNTKKINKILLLIIIILCSLSIAMLIPVIIDIVQRKGWQGMIEISFHCK